mgnify:CR=1 FL=1
MGLNFKLDVGLYRLCLQVACQRIGKKPSDAKTSFSDAKEAVANLFARSDFSFALAA